MSYHHNVLFLNIKATIASHDRVRHGNIIEQLVSHSCQFLARRTIYIAVSREELIYHALHDAYFDDPGKYFTAFPSLRSLFLCPGLVTARWVVVAIFLWFVQCSHIKRLLTVKLKISCRLLLFLNHPVLFCNLLHVNCTMMTLYLYATDTYLFHINLSHHRLPSGLRTDSTALWLVRFFWASRFLKIFISPESIIQ